MKPAIKKNDKDKRERVANLQIALQKLHYAQPSFGVDGIPGSEFFNTVKTFCSDYRVIPLLNEKEPEKIQALLNTSIIASLQKEVLPVDLEEFILTKALEPENYLRGVDISEHQQEVNFTALKRSGIGFLYVRGSIGEKSQDQRFGDNKERLKEALRNEPDKNFYWGVYHLWTQSGTPKKQADNLCKAIQNTKTSEIETNLIPALDIEGKLHLSSEAVNDQLNKTIEEIEKNIGVKPLIYTSARICDEWLLTAGGSCPAWLVGWKKQDISIPIKTNFPRIPLQWVNFHIWQTGYGGKYLGGVPGVGKGIDIDRNLCKPSKLKDLIIRA